MRDQPKILYMGNRPQSSVQYAKPYEGNHLWKHNITANETNITKTKWKSCQQCTAHTGTVKNWWGWSCPAAGTAVDEMSVSDRTPGGVKHFTHCWRDSPSTVTHHDSSSLTVNKTCTPHTIPAFTGFIKLVCQTAKNVNRVHNFFALTPPVPKVCTVEHFETTCSTEPATTVWS